MAVGIMGIGFGGTPSGMRIDVVDIAKDGQSIKSVIHMPTGLTKRFRGLRLGPDGALYAAVDEGEILQKLLQRLGKYRRFARVIYK